MAQHETFHSSFDYPPSRAIYSPQFPPIPLGSNWDIYHLYLILVFLVLDSWVSI
ncbi:hypothetical protein L211DRAFT_841016 [Terfezia boudieri ATCC MYA-4762]|uniref:Uncharacterized protein n=1 Tax=Terfezia boudieri ATCC MYA-4762 TaxID=1051890 RepID=A0A3N4LDS1_9PEZI|nr:hypothetical protein L211DRAFT_841016 [Terfezia boudieri ATCC MYA-4762]